MSSCGLCGHEVNNDPYREPPPMTVNVPQEKPKPKFATYREEASAWAKNHSTLASLLGIAVVVLVASGVLFGIGAVGGYASLKMFAVGLPVVAAALTFAVVGLPRLGSYIGGGNDPFLSWMGGLLILVFGGLAAGLVGVAVYYLGIGCISLGQMILAHL